MRKLLLLFLAGWLVFSISCDNPTESKSNPYEQHAIEWPSLADSPWPMRRHDPQGTGRTSLTGPSQGDADYFPLYPPAVGRIYIEPVVLSDRYLIGTEDGYCFVLNDTELIWQKRFCNEYFNFISTPLIVNDNSIWMCSDTLYNFSILGQIQAKYPLPFKNYSGLTIDLDGYFYMTNGNNQLYKYSQDGDKIWEITIPGKVNEYSVSVFSPDGNYLYLAGAAIWAIDISDGSIYWQWKINDDQFSLQSPSVDNEGEIYWPYCIADTLYLTALNKDGSVRWQYKDGIENGYYSAPAIDHQGNILQTFNNKLIKFSHQGQIIFEYSLQGSVIAGLTIDKRDNIYFGYSNRKALESIDSDGNLIWSVATNTGFDTPVVIIRDGVAICGSSTPRYPNTASLYFIK